VLPLTVGIRYGVVRLVSTLGSAVECRGARMRWGFSSDGDVYDDDDRDSVGSY
jgi:hypothetical protein